MGIIGITTVLQVTDNLGFLFLIFLTGLSNVVLIRLFSCQILIIEFLGKFFKTVRLNWRLWLVSVAIGLVRYALQNVSTSYGFEKFTHPSKFAY